MKAVISWASAYGYSEKKTFNTLKQLLDWQKEIKEDIIIGLQDEDGVYPITVYDDYVE